MKLAFLLAAALAAFTVIAADIAVAAENALGRQEYLNRCASCHGAGAKGDGWMAKYLSRRPPGLTRLAARNGGAFPFDYAYQVIDGRKAVELHGPRNMPVWGTVIPSEIERKTFGLSKADIVAAERRIHALVRYLEEVQE